uniref:Uncharacterized protein n=1 Tax=Anguilla anguilla TaxID=7936 RepID=A0A0E9PTM0_ANGAN
MSLFTAKTHIRQSCSQIKPQISFPHMSHHHYVQRSIHKMGPPILETFFFLQT